MFAPPHAGLISSRPVLDTETLAAEFDAPWKIGLELFLEPFLQFSFPAVHALIDWREPPVFLDTELQQIAPAHDQGERSVDKLVRVRLRDGREEWLLIHVEIQAQRDQEFPARMWVYYYRIFDKFGQRIISLAVLADDQQDWRPHTYHTELGGCVQHFEFPVFKVIECADAVGEFERTDNPFALLVAAHQVALVTRHDAPRRCQERFRLVRYLYRHGLERKQVLDLFRLIAWLTRLPENWELQFQEQLVKFEQSEPAMTKETLLSPLELILQRKFREEASRLAVLDALEARFGAVPAEIQDKVQQMSDDARLRQALRLAVTAPTLQRFLENA